MKKTSSIVGPTIGKKESGNSCKLIVHKPQAIVIDLLGVLINKTFMTSSKEFKDFFTKNLTEFLHDSWKQKQLRITINFFRCSQQNVPEEFKLADRDESREDQIKQAKRHVLWKTRNDPTNSALSLFFLVITEWGYKNRLLTTGVYEEVSSILKQWKETAKIPVYVGVGSADFLVMILSNTSQGNILPFFNGHMNIMDYDGNTANKDFRKLVAILRLPPEKVLYLTRFRQDCKRAMENGLQSVIVLRPDFDVHKVIPIIKHKRAIMSVIDGTQKARPTTPEDTTQAKVKKLINDSKQHQEVKKEIVENIGSLSMIDDTSEEGSSRQASTITEADCVKYNVVLSLSDIIFK